MSTFANRRSAPWLAPGCIAILLAACGGGNDEVPGATMPGQAGEPAHAPALELGMASFADILTEQDVEDMHADLIARANEDWGHEE